MIYSKFKRVLDDNTAYMKTKDEVKYFKSAINKIFL